MMEQILQKMGRIREYLRIIDSIGDGCLKRFNTDSIYRGALLYYLYLLSDSCISLAEMVIRHRNLRLPQSYHEAIDILGEAKIIEPEFAYEFAKIAGFRNFLAHDYEKVDAEFICKEILPKTEDVKKYLSQIEESLGKEQGGGDG